MAPIGFNYNYLRSLILPLDEIDNAIPLKGKIIDLGCGQGVISNYLASKKRRTVIGIDKNVSRLSRSPQKNLFFKKGDITNISIKNVDGVIISDVLHHLSVTNQKILLKKTSTGLNKNGVLVVKEIDTEEFVRSKLSRVWDYLLYPKDDIHFSRTTDMKRLLLKLGFKVTILRPSRLFPGSTTLYVCKK